MLGPLNNMGFSNNFRIPGLTRNETKLTLSGIVGTKRDELLRSAKAGIKTVKVIKVGDSTDDVNNYFDVLVKYFNMLNVSCYQNAQSGQSGQDWKNNADQTTLQQCIDACIGVDGEDTIVLYSHGLNDYKNGATEAQVKGWLIEGINLLKAAKPRVNIVLVSPVLTANEDRNVVLKRIYDEMSVELNLKLIDSTISTTNIHGTAFYYADPTHPNIYGHERRIVYMLHELLPSDLYKHIVLKEKEVSPPPSALELFDGLTDTGSLWNTEDGLSYSSATWLKVRNRIPVEPNFILNIEHYGTRSQALFYDQNDVFLGTYSTIAVVGQNYKQVTIPANAWFMRLNITNSISTYTNTKISIKYFIATSTDRVTIDKILDGLSISFPRPIEPMIDSSSLVILDKSISISKCDFISLGKNLFDKDHLTTNYALQDGGLTVASATYAYTTNAVPIVAGQVYNTNVRFRFITYYNASGAVIGEGTHTFPLVGNFTPPSNAVSAKFTVYQADAIATLQVEKGSVNTTFETFGYFISLPNGNKVRLG
jgi:hypothetical protein